MDICIPGSFIVLQGTPGDGACNTIDSLPDFRIQQQQHQLQQQSPTAAAAAGSAARISSSRPSLFTSSSTSTTTTTACLGGLVPPLLQTSPILRPFNDNSSSNNNNDNTNNNNNCYAVANHGNTTTVSPNVTAAVAPTTLSITNTTETNTAATAASIPSSSDESYVVVVALSNNSASENDDDDNSVQERDYQTDNSVEENIEQDNSVELHLPQQQQQQAIPEYDLGEDAATDSLQQQQEQHVIVEWQESCRQRRVQERKEWIEDAIMNGMTDQTHNSNNHHHHHVIGTTTSWMTRQQQQQRHGHEQEDDEWWRHNGCLVVMAQLPNNNTMSMMMENSARSFAEIAMGKMNVFALPTSILPPSPPPQQQQQPVQLLSPGTVIMAQELITLNSTTLQVEPVVPLYRNISTANDEDNDENSATMQQQIYPPGRQGWIQCLKITSPCIGYVVLSVDGYPFCLPGHDLTTLAQLDQWYWRVTCPVGALVREGLDLSTIHKATLPYGSILQVTRKTINAVGLSRLQMKGFVWTPPLPLPQDDKEVARELNQTEDSSSSCSRYSLVEGWCSEFLNPLSGQRGPIVQPLSLPAPMLYKVILPEGAVIRSDIELSSPQIGHAPIHTVLAVTGRAFSEHPVDSCIERLRLAGGGGWISARLNKLAPHNKPIVELVGIDPSFDPNHAGVYHVQAMKQVQETRHQEHQQSGAIRSRSNSSHSACESLDDLHQHHPSGLSPHSSVSFSPSPTEGSKPHHHHREDDTCLVCLSHSRNATLVHGPTGHIACCLNCARILKARGAPCPVCRSPIDLVIQHFYA